MVNYDAGAQPGSVALSRSGIKYLLLKLYYPRVQSCSYFIMSAQEKNKSVSFNTYLATEEEEKGLWCMNL